MKFHILCLIALTFSIFTQSIKAGSFSDSDTGYICVSSVPKQTGGETSLANPAGGNRTFNYSIQIDRGAIKPVSDERGIRITGLVLKQKHLVKIRRDGKIVQSFWFAFEAVGSNELCLWFKSLYETWSLWTVKEAKNNCDCK